MIVVLGDEEHKIDDADLYVQARMQSRAPDKLFIVTIKAADKFHSFFAELDENVLDRVRVVIRFMGLAVCHVGGNQSLASIFVVVETTHS